MERWRIRGRRNARLIVELFTTSSPTLHLSKLRHQLQMTKRPVTLRATSIRRYANSRSQRLSLLFKSRWHQTPLAGISMRPRLVPEKPWAFGESTLASPCRPASVSGGLLLGVVTHSEPEVQYNVFYAPCCPLLHPLHVSI